MVVKGLLRQQIKLGFQGSLLTLGCNVDSGTELDIKEALFETKAFLLSDADKVVGLEGILQAWKDLSDAPQDLG